MEKSSRDEIILLFDYFNRGSLDLFESFKNAKLPCKAVVINDDGFLPDDVINVFEYFLGDFKEKEGFGKPRFFNQIKVPDYWEISANNNSGSIHDKERERGRIFFAEPTHKRYVNVVDFLDEDGNVRCSEHYNRYGGLYARTIFNKISQKVNKSYFDADGKEVIVENYVTGDIILNRDGKSVIFKSKAEFVTYFIRLMGWENKRIFFNSLSVPFFVENSLKPNGEKNDILFWQEQTGAEIPGNMQVILQGNGSRCKKVVVQNRISYNRLLTLGAPKDKISELGYIYSFKKENHGKLEALICTNTENVEKLKELLEALPQMKFHVAALTEMSGKLLSHEKYDNVVMYPNIKASTLDSLFMKCDFFLDINHEGEIVEATRKAFIHNLLILAFQETSHGSEYTAEENIFPIKAYKDLINRLEKLTNDKDELKMSVDAQRMAGLTAKSGDYSF